MYITYNDSVNETFETSFEGKKAIDSAFSRITYIYLLLLIHFLPILSILRKECES